MSRVHIIDHSAEVVSLTAARLRRDLQASVDLINLGAVMCDAGSQINSAGRHVMQLNELPTEHMISEIEFTGMALVKMANEIRAARRVLPVVEG